MINITLFVLLALLSQSGFLEMVCQTKLKTLLKLTNCVVDFFQAEVDSEVVPREGSGEDTTSSRVTSLTTSLTSRTDTAAGSPSTREGLPSLF